jgi:hypothetical protein
MYWALAVGGIAVAASAQTLHTRPATPAKPEPVPAPVVVAAPPALLAQGTYLNVASTRVFPMKQGEQVEARLLSPIYVNNELVLPAGTLLRGRVESLRPDRAARIWARLDGDFTPIHQPMVRFEAVETSGGAVAIHAEAAQAGLPMVSLNASAVSKRHALVAQAWNGMKQRVSDTKSYFTSPGVGNRLKEALYSQLPYHPEQINAGTSWSFPLMESLPVSVLKASGTPTVYAPPKKKPKKPARSAAPKAAAAGKTSPARKTSPDRGASAAPRPHWLIHAELETPLNSRLAKAGDPIEARVVEPIYDAHHQLAIPEGATLVGRVTTSKSARSFGRNGHLRFSFQQLRIPAGATQSVQGSVTGAMASGGRQMNMDAEGNVTGKKNGSVLAPLALGLLAGHALDTDGNMTAQTGVASNGFGVVGRVVGLTAGSRSLAAGLGFYAVGLTIAHTWLHDGHQIVFPQGTRIDIDTSPLTEPILKPQTEGAMSGKRLR